MSSTDTKERIAEGKSSPASADRDHPTEKVGLLVDGRYQIVSLIGRGGMGSVYKAEHKGIGRMVALKLLHPSLASVPEVSKRFEREAIAVGRIEHPNCVDVSDFGQLADGSLFLVMEYLEGQSLGDLLEDDKRIDPMRALHIMKHMLRGLGHAHGADIVHRDIKPENVHLVDEDGDKDFAKILDFGIAKLIGSTGADVDVKLTQAGVAFGTPVYMSPEQAVGNPVDGRADLYAATLVLFEMIAGKVPFYSDDKLEVLSMHTTRPVPSVADIAPGVSVPPQIERLMNTGLAKRPGERFATAEAYIAAIDGVIAELTQPRSARGKVATRIPKRAATAPVVYGPPTGKVTLTTALPVTPKARKRLLLVGAAIGAIVAVAILAALAGSGEDKAPQRAAVPVQARSAVGDARDALEHGDADKAIELLEQKTGEITESGPAQLLLGHAYGAKERNRDALRAYERALTLTPDGADETLRKNLLKLMDSKSRGLGLDAADILMNFFHDEQAAAKLIKLASSERSNTFRHRALELAEKHGLGDKVDKLSSLALDLSHGERCGERLKAVLALRKLGDKRAIKPLKVALRRRSKSTNPKYKGKLINVCLAKQAKAAIAELGKH